MAIQSANKVGPPVWNGTTWIGGWDPNHPAWNPNANPDYDKMPTNYTGQPVTGGGGGSGGSGGVGGGSGGSGGSAGGTPGAAQISTSITPRPVYTDAMTTTARNMAVNDAMRRASPISVYKKFDRPGASRSLATQSLAMPKIAAAYVDAAKAKAGIPLADMIANEQNLFQGQMARANEMMGLGRLALGEQSLNNYSVQQLIQMMAPLLGSVL